MVVDLGAQPYVEKNKAKIDNILQTCHYQKGAARTTPGNKPSLTRAMEKEIFTILYR